MKGIPLTALGRVLIDDSLVHQRLVDTRNMDHFRQQAIHKEAGIK